MNLTDHGLKSVFGSDSRILRFDPGPDGNLSRDPVHEFASIRTVLKRLREEVAGIGATDAAVFTPAEVINCAGKASLPVWGYVLIFERSQVVSTLGWPSV